MNEDKALKFAVEAHKNQFRKEESDKPYVFHSIDVSNILKEYNFDENVIVAGLLHDVLKDSKKTILDIFNDFGRDVASLVYETSVINSKENVEHISELDLRHKAVICADKISDLEDLYITFGKNKRVDFSSFNKGFQAQGKYYSDIFNNLIKNERDLHPMFMRLEELINKVFYNDDINIYLRNIVFEDDSDRYSELQVLKHKKAELLKLKSLSDNIGPYVIEFTGTPRTYKSSTINVLVDFFSKANFNVDKIDKFITSKRYYEELLTGGINNNKVDIAMPKIALKELNECIKHEDDIIIANRLLFDRLIWINRLFVNNEITKEEYECLVNNYVPLIKDNIDITIGTYTDGLTSVKRDYKTYLALEDRKFINEKNLKDYNKSLSNMGFLCSKKDINFNLFDTTNKNESDFQIEVTNYILDDMRKTYIKRLKKEFEG